MTRENPTDLRLHVEEPPRVKRPSLDQIQGLASLCESFQQMTGWSLRYYADQDPKDPPVWSRMIEETHDGQRKFLSLDPASGAGSRRAAESADWETVEQLAESIGELLDELQRTRHSLSEREAELAAALPVTPHRDEEAHLAVRLEAVLKAAAQAVDCQAAAVYLLDEDTRQLKLRTAWGLPKSRFLDPPRPLRGAAADLEALVGHAVTLQDNLLLPHWRVPEEFRSAVCVPVSTPTMPLGTLWMFCDNPRKFTESETNIIEITAGRVAADLEREVLMQESLQSRLLNRQLNHAAHWQHSRLPRIKPLLDGWQVAGGTMQADRLGGDFHDWQILPDGALAVTIGDAQGRMFEAGLTAATLHTALKSHAMYRHTAQEMAQRINDTLWTASTGDQFASLFYALIQPETGQMEHVSVGHVSGAVAGERLHVLSNSDPLPLGTQPDSDFDAVHTEISPGDAVVVVSDGVARALRDKRLRLLWRQIHKHRRETAEQLLERAQQFIAQQDERPGVEDQTILIVKRNEV